MPVTVATASSAYVEATVAAMDKVKGELTVWGTFQAPHVVRTVASLLSGIPEAEAVHRYARSIILERGDFNGRVLSVRRDDLRAICSLLHATETQTLQQLREWDALVEGL